MFVYCSTSSLLVRVYTSFGQTKQVWGDFVVVVLIQEKIFYWEIDCVPKAVLEIFLYLYKRNLLIKCLMFSTYTLLLQV